MISRTTILQVLGAMLPLVLSACAVDTGDPGGAVASTSPLAISRPLPTIGVPACGAAAPGFAECHAIVVTEADGVTARTTSTPTGFSPAQLTSAYQIPAGFGGTVAIVAAYDNPNAYTDLQVYRSTFGLPACTTASGCFRKVNQSGATSPLPATDPGWSKEIALDLDMASAGCPGCNLLLIEAASTSITDLGAAVNRAAAMGATVISNSYGGLETASAPAYDALYYNHPGIAMTVSSGDNGSHTGHSPQYPASGAHMIAVGGTTLTAASNQRGWSESVWGSTTAGAPGSGAGCSQFVSKPSWQTDTGCTMRTVADVSAVADMNTPVAVYDSYPPLTGWSQFYGTSVGAPLVAGILADTGRGAIDASWFYAHPGALHDVTTGASGVSTPAYLTTGEVGYDGPSGLGTLNGGSPLATPRCGVMFAGDSLSPGQSLYSCNGSHVLVQQADGNLVLYRMSPWGWTWQSGSWAHGGYYAVMGGDGNFVVYNNQWQGVWQSGTYGHPGAILSVQDDGNMVVYSSLWAPLWATGT